MTDADRKPLVSEQYPNAVVKDDAREAVMVIAERIKGMGPGFLVPISMRPGQWQALLDCIPGPDGDSQ